MLETIAFTPNYNPSLTENQWISNHESQPLTHLKHRPTHHTKPSPYYKGVLLPLQNAPTSRRKRGLVPNLCILLFISILSRVTAIATSPLAAPPCPLYLSALVRLRFTSCRASTLLVASILWLTFAREKDIPFATLACVANPRPQVVIPVRSAFFCEASCGPQNLLTFLQSTNSKEK